MRRFSASLISVLLALFTQSIVVVCIILIFSTLKSKSGAEDLVNFYFVSGIAALLSFLCSGVAVVTSFRSLYRGTEKRAQTLFSAIAGVVCLLASGGELVWLLIMGAFVYVIGKGSR